MEIRVDDRPVFVYTAAHAFEATRPSIVWVHGAGLDHSWWALQSRYFGYHGWNVLAVDLPGHGRSAGPAIAGIDAQAEWVLRLMDAIGVQQAAVVGHSMGSLIALACAARAPDRIRALALLGTAFPMQVSAAFLAAAKANSVDAFDMETIWGHAPDVPFASNPNPGMWMYGDTLARLSRLAPGVLHTDLQSCNDYQGGLTVYLDDKLKPETNLFDRSVLLHEMVHYLQQSNLPSSQSELSIHEKCVLWYTREREAYAVQEAFLIMVASPVRAGYFPARADC